MTSRNFKQSMVNQDQEIIFEVVKVSGSWVFPAASSIVEATRGKNMYLRLTDDGKSDIFRLDSVKDGENAGETVFGFVGNGGMDLVELTATTDGAGVTTGSWEYAPGEGPAGEAIGNLGKPLQWKGPATVAQLNAGITGIQAGWTYTLTDSGTLTAGSVKVEAGDEVAWGASEEWVKIGSETKTLVKDEAIGVEWAGNPAMVGDVVMHDGLRFVCTTSNMDEEWIPEHWAPLTVGTDIQRLQRAIGSVKNGGALTDAASVNVPNNALSTLSTAQSALTLNVNVGTDDVPNFAVEVTPSADCTLTVTKTVGTGGMPTALTPSVAGGNALTSGKLYQVTCVGSCWTLAEFAMPNP